MSHRCLVLLMLAGSLITSLRAVDPTPQVDVAGFRQHALPLIQQHCLRCHGEREPQAGLSLIGLSPELGSGQDLAKWRKVIDRVRKGEMPPEEEPRPTPAHVQRFLDWTKRELRKVDADQLARVAVGVMPGQGNQVDHDALFHDPITTTIDAPPRLWRVSPPLYEALSIEVVRSKGKIANAIPTAGHKGFQDYAALAQIDEPTTAQLIRNAHAMVACQTDYQTVEGRLKTRFNSVREFLPLFDPMTTPTPRDMETAIQRQFQIVLMRAPEPDELRDYLALMNRNITISGRDIGGRSTLAAVLLTPEFLFRMELGEGTPDARGLVRLTQREIAFALAYALDDRRPDAPLLQAAEQGKLATREQVIDQVKRLLAEPKWNRARILRFFREYFEYSNAIDVFKDTKDFKEHSPRTYVHDTDQLVQYLLAKDHQVFRELLTTRLSFVNATYDTKKKLYRPAEQKPVQLAYGLTEWPQQQPTELDGTQRMGILTQPSWLVAHSLNADNHPILRGKWIRERLLGGSVPDLPITVDAQLPEDAKLTLRERMKVTEQAYCWNCHKQMNPLGLPFEQYDHFGRHRSEEIGKPVVSTGRIDRSGHAALDGEVGDSLKMIAKLADSPRVQEVWIRHVFRYWMGRNETLGDAQTLRDMNRAYMDSDGSMNALLIALMSSDSFLYRKPVRVSSSTSP